MVLQRIPQRLQKLPQRLSPKKSTNVRGIIANLY